MNEMNETSTATLTASTSAPYTRLALVYLNEPEGYREHDFTPEGWGNAEYGVDESWSGEKPFYVGATWDGATWNVLGCLNARGLCNTYPIRAETSFEAVSESVREMLHDAHISGDTLAVQAVVF